MKRYAIMFEGTVLQTYDAETAEEALSLYLADAREWCDDYVLDDRVYAGVI